ALVLSRVAPPINRSPATRTSMANQTGWGTAGTIWDIWDGNSLSFLISCRYGRTTALVSAMGLVIPASAMAMGGCLAVGMDTAPVTAAGISAMAATVATAVTLDRDRSQTATSKPRPLRL